MTGGTLRGYAGKSAEREAGLINKPTLVRIRASPSRLGVVLRVIATGRWLRWCGGIRSSGRWQVEYVFDYDVQLGSSEMYWRPWVPGLLATENRGPRDFARPCQVQRGLQTDLPAFFDRQCFIAYRERSERMLEEVSVDRVFLVKHDLWERGYREILELTNG